MILPNILKNENNQISLNTPEHHFLAGREK